MASPSARTGIDHEQMLQTVVSNAPIVLFALDLDGVFTLSEGRGLDALRLKPGQVVGKSVFHLYRDYPVILDACRRALAGETLTRTLHVQGVTFDARFSPQLDWGGKVTGMLGVAVDVTESYRAALSKDEFLSVISHELRTPLSSASGWAWMMREGELSGDETTKALEVVCRNLEDLKRLIGELRDASKAATGRLPLKVKPVDLAACVKLAAKSLAGAAKAKEQSLEVSASALRAPADKERVRQIAWILLSNAVKYSPNGAKISARLERRDGEAALTVSDSGPGIPAALKAHLFDLNRPASEDGPPRGRGLGLGLGIARRLAELHGGRIEHADGAEGGSVFSLFLPLAAR